MTNPWKVNVFGVRHLSPAGAWHLRRYLDQIQPELVLIEGLSDASELISQITRKGTKPPIALLAYTDSLPVRTLIYPMARYSPEFQAMSWANEHDATVEFIDLPSDIFLALQDIEQELLDNRRKRAPDGTPPHPAQRPPKKRFPIRRRPPPSLRSVSISNMRFAPASPITKLTGNAISSTMSMPMPIAWRRTNLANPCESWNSPPRAGGRKTWFAKPTCAVRSRRRFPVAMRRKRSSRSSAHFTRRC